MITKNNKAIILLNPPYDRVSHQLTNDLIKACKCKDNNLSVIKIIQSKGMYDSSAFHKLIKKVINSHYKPITVIIDKEFHNSPVNMLTMCVLGTLSAAKLIRIFTYEKQYLPSHNYYLGLKSQILTEQESNFLYVAAGYFKNILTMIIENK